MTRPRNIILLVVDSLRYDTAYNKGLRMPYVERKGVQFSQVRSAGCWTLPATTSLFTGKMPHEHGATSQTRGFKPELPTLAEQLKAKGYSTVQCTANVATTDIFGLNRGFDEVHRIWEHVTPRFKRMLNIALMIGKPRIRRMLFSKDYLFQRMADDFRMGIAWAQTTYEDTFDFARKKLADNEAKGENTFLFLNLMEAHFPYHVAPTFKLTGNGLIEKVRESVAMYHTLNLTSLKTGKHPVKPDMEQLLHERQAKSWELLSAPLDAFLKEMHEDKNNLVIFCSDHGDNFGDQGWMYHFSNVTEGGNRVPMVWLDHNHQQPARTLNNPVSSRFVYNDILRAAGIEIQGDSLFAETATNLPLLQSYWYNNDNKTLPQFRYNQLCFIEGDSRYVYRDDVHRNFSWMKASTNLSTNKPEDNFVTVDNGFNPIEEAVTDTERKTYLRNTFAQFKQFSDGIRK